VKNVAGVFRHDTLFFVWEDYRNGDPDIYGNYWPVPTTLQRVYGVKDTTHSPTDSTQHPPIDSTEHTDSTVKMAGELAIRSVAPNPATTHVDVKFLLRNAGSVSLELYDMLGRRVGEYHQIVPTGEQILHIDMNGLAPGAYTIVLRSERGLDRRRVIIE
jgi:hypothetical protein